MNNTYPLTPHQRHKQELQEAKAIHTQFIERKESGEILSVKEIQADKEAVRILSHEWLKDIDNASGLLLCAYLKGEAYPRPSYDLFKDMGEDEKRLAKDYIDTVFSSCMKILKKLGY